MKIEITAFQYGDVQDNLFPFFSSFFISLWAFFSFITSNISHNSTSSSFCSPLNFVLPSFCSPFFSSALIGCLEWAFHSPSSSSSHLFPSFFPSYPLLPSLLPLSLSQHLSLYLFCPLFLFPLLLLNSLSLAYMAYM